MGFTKKQDLGIYRKSLYALSAVAALSLYAMEGQESKATTMNNTYRAQQASTSGIPNTKVQHKFGVTVSNFRVLDDKTISPNKRYVQFWDSKGQLKTYEEGFSTKAKLLWNAEEMGIDTYVDESGKIRKYVYRSQPNWVSGQEILALKDRADDSRSLSSVKSQSDVKSTISADSSSTIWTDLTSTTKKSSVSSVSTDSTSTIKKNIDSDFDKASTVVSDTSSSSKSTVKSNSSIGSIPGEGSSVSDVLARSSVELTPEVQKKDMGTQTSTVQKTTTNADTQTNNRYRTSLNLDVVSKEGKISIQNKNNLKTVQVDEDGKSIGTVSNAGSKTSLKSTATSLKSGSSLNESRTDEQPSTSGETSSKKSLTITTVIKESPNRGLYPISEESASDISSSSSSSVKTVTSVITEDGKVHPVTLVNIDGETSKKKQ